MKEWNKLFLRIKSAISVLAGEVDSVKIISALTFNQETEIIAKLKSLQFVETNNGWVRKFVKVLVQADGIYIGHFTEKKSDLNFGLTKIENPITSLSAWIKYFDTI